MKGSGENSISKYLEPVTIVGCGYVGGRLARTLTQAGNIVNAMHRSPESAPIFSDQGITPVFGDLDDVFGLRAINISSHVLYYLAPPTPGASGDCRMRAFTGSVRGKPSRAVLISTTGVYGDQQGQWVTESTPVRPSTARARRRLDAERVFSSWCRRGAIPYTVLRVAGIYGPGRLPLARLRRGEPILDPSFCGFTNRIHVDDLVQACVKAATDESGEVVFNICDGNPSNMAEYFLTIAALSGLPPPPLIDPAEARHRLSSGMQEYLSESRRIDNRMMREVLGVEIRYSDFREGVRQSLQVE